VDARLAYDFGARFQNGFLAGLTAALSLQNALDRKPPHTALVFASSDSGFDPTNANPLGRLIAVG
jgi:iron complex outermembrane recepter protein